MENVQFLLNLHALLASTAMALKQNSIKLGQIENLPSSIDMEFLDCLYEDILRAAGDFVLAAGDLVSADRQVE